MKQKPIVEFEAPYKVTYATSRHKVKTSTCNTNIVTNLHHRHYGALKRQYKEEIRKLDLYINITGQIEIEYNLYHNRARHDLSNISPVEKFLEDALAELGLIEDDNTSIVPQTRRRYAGYSKSVKIIVKIYKFIK